MEITKENLVFKNEMMAELGLARDDINATSNPITNTHFAKKVLGNLETFIRNAHDNAQAIAEPDPTLMRSVKTIIDTKLGHPKDLILAYMVADNVLYAHIAAYGKPAHEQQKYLSAARRVLFDTIREEAVHTRRLQSLGDSFTDNVTRPPTSSGRNT